jgi:membrane protease subunit HflK
MYLPLDKLTNRVAEEAPAASTVAHEPVSIATPPVKEIKTDVRASSRERDVRGR